MQEADAAAYELNYESRYDLSLPGKALLQLIEVPSILKSRTAKSLSSQRVITSANHSVSCKPKGRPPQFKINLPFCGRESCTLRSSRPICRSTCSKETSLDSSLAGVQRHPAAAYTPLMKAGQMAQPVAYRSWTISVLYQAQEPQLSTSRIQHCAHHPRSRLRESQSEPANLSGVVYPRDSLCYHLQVLMIRKFNMPAVAIALQNLLHCFSLHTQ